MDYKLIGALGVLGIAAGIVGLSFVDKKQKVSSIKRQTLIRVLEELKHQVFMICMKGAPQFAKEYIKLKKDNRTNDAIKQLLEQKALNVYEKKERLILVKHEITKQQFEKALEKDFSKDKEIAQYKEDIEVMLEDVTGGKTPILNVPSQLKNSLKPSAALQLVKNLKISQLTVLLSSFQKAAKQNPNFIIGDNPQTTNIIKKVDLYNIKVTYLQQNGPQVQSMNHYNFIQIIELYCFESPQFKSKIDKIEHLYSIYSDMMGFEVDLEKMKQQFDKALNEVKEVKQETIIEVNTPEQIKKQVQIINNFEQNVLEVNEITQKVQEKIEQNTENQISEIKQIQVIDSSIQQPETTAPQSKVVIEQTDQGVSQYIPQKDIIDQSANVESKEIENLQYAQQNEQQFKIQNEEQNLQQNQEKREPEQK